MSHLREQADFIRVLGSYPSKSRLVGPVLAAAEETQNMVVDPKDISLATLPSDLADTKPLNIGIVGFGTFGQFLAKRMSQKHRVACVDKVDKVSIMLSVVICCWSHHHFTIRPYDGFVIRHAVQRCAIDRCGVLSFV